MWTLLLLPTPYFCSGLFISGFSSLFVSFAQNLPQLCMHSYLRPIWFLCVLWLEENTSAQQWRVPVPSLPHGHTLSPRIWTSALCGGYALLRSLLPLWAFFLSALEVEAAASISSSCAPQCPLLALSVNCPLPQKFLC